MRRRLRGAITPSVQGSAVCKGLTNTSSVGAATAASAMIDMPMSGATALLRGRHDADAHRLGCERQPIDNQLIAV